MSLGGRQDRVPRYPDVALYDERPEDFEFMVMCSSQAFGDAEAWTRDYFVHTLAD